MIVTCCHSHDYFCQGEYTPFQMAIYQVEGLNSETVVRVGTCIEIVFTFRTRNSQINIL